MKNNGFMLIGVLLFSFSTAHALNENALLTPRDIATQSYSNITIQNKTGSTVQAFGLYINRLANLTAPNASCATPNVVYMADQAGGSVVTPVTFQTNQVVHVGQNYLYNMIFSAIYYANQSSVSPCMLPGCGWLTDTAPTKWCLYLGVLSPNKNNTASKANIPPYAFNVSGSGYNYDLVSNYHYIGPIQCNDRTMTCSVPNAQNQAFP